MFQHGGHHRLDVVGRHEVASGQRGAGPAGEQEGLRVGKTVKFSDSRCVSRSMLTNRSCIACSRADCVFAGARLISSASRNEVKTGPFTSVNSFFCRLKTLVPMMSDGMRSGVN